MKGGGLGTGDGRTAAQHTNPQHPKLAVWHRLWLQTSWNKSGLLAALMLVDLWADSDWLGMVLIIVSYHRHSETCSFFYRANEREG